MNMIPPGLDLVIVLFAVQVHEVQLIHEPEFLEQFNGAVHGGTIDAGFSLPRQLQQGSCIEMGVSLLNDFDKRTALSRHSYALCDEFVQEMSSLKLGANHRSLVATESHLPRKGARSRDSSGLLLANELQQDNNFTLSDTSLFNPTRRPAYKSTENQQLSCNWL